MILLKENGASLVLLLAVLAIVYFMIRSSIREKKQGKCSCGCGGSCGRCGTHAKTGGNV